MDAGHTIAERGMEEKTKMIEKERKKIIMVLKRAHKKRFKMLGGSFD